MTSILWMIAAVVIAFWVVGFFMNVAGSLIHILLVVAAALIIYNLMAGRRRV